MISNGASFDGRAAFKKIHPNVMRLKETGAITMPDGSGIEASRYWLWKFVDLNQLDILYDEEVPRLYHSLSFATNEDGWISEAIHHCGKDDYFGRYKFVENLLTIDHQIRGPAKNYDVSSRYSR